MTKARAPKFVIPSFFTNIHKAMMKELWNEIGDDVCELCENQVNRDDVIEFVLDAGRLEELTIRHSHMGKLDWSEFRKLPYNQQVACAKTVFRYGNYAK